MKIIVCATFSEAKAMIEKFNLRRIISKPFLIHSNGSIVLIVSGIGKLNSAIATAYMAHYNKIESIINVGICGTNDTKKEIGSLHTVKSIVDVATGKKVTVDKTGEVLYTFDEVVDTKSNLKKSVLIDMEGYGFYKAAKNFTKKDNIKIYKIISDYLETTHITSDFVYDLIKQNLQEIHI